MAFVFLSTPGIAIGVIVGVILIIAAAWFLCCQLRKG